EADQSCHEETEGEEVMSRRITGTCWITGCGRDADGSLRMCSRCYGSTRNWSANKTSAEREKRRENTLLYQARLNGPDEGLVKINHIRETKNDKIRRQRSNTGPARNPHRRRQSGRSGTRAGERSGRKASIPAPSSKTVQ